MTEINVYAQISTQMRALLASERRMGPDDRRPYSWMIRAEYHDTSITVIKGGANTIILQFGDERHEPCFPDDALRLLLRLKTQPYQEYAVVRANGARKMFYDLQRALRVKPREGDRIGGISGTKRVVTHDARNGVGGSMKWIPRR